MIRSLLLACVLISLASPAGSEAPSTAPVAAAETQKRIIDIETRVNELEKTAKGADLLGLARSIDTRLQGIQTKIPELERWSTWAVRLDGVASAVRTTRGWTLAILVVSVALAVGSLVTTLLAHEKMNKAVTDIAGMVRSVTDRQPTPMVVAAEPASGPLGGGTPVRIRGRNFNRGAAARFGRTAAATTVVSPEELTAPAPAGTAGPCDISVQNPDGGLDTLHNGYTYVPGPLIQGVLPVTSPVQGTILTVFGAHFQPGATVRLNGNATPTHVLSENHVTCQLGPGAAGQTVTVAIANPDQQVHQWLERITYV